jgi:hypothetical protein
MRYMNGNSMSTIPDELWRRFARFTVQTKDLDPMYDLIYNGRMKYGLDWAEQYALTFFLFYDAGEAAKMARVPTDEYWEVIANWYPHFKRGTERRHFRGDKGFTAVSRMRKMGDPHTIWETMYGTTYTELRKNIEVYFHSCQIGPYFIWKAMDIMDRCLGMPIDCSGEEALVGLPDEPREAAKYFFPDLTLIETLYQVSQEVEEMTAPGEPNRMCDYPEAETILCMMKGYFGTKTHTIGDDVDEKHEQLKDYPELRSLLPPQLIWKTYEQAMDSTRLSADGS